MVKYLSFHNPSFALRYFLMWCWLWQSPKQKISWAVNNNTTLKLGEGFCVRTRPVGQAVKFWDVAQAGFFMWAWNWVCLSFA
jgi:hypothetical protein